jgi:pyruvate/2-oxoglutarate dehydrogenase complex dihydrolipoamide dehydrogenase (E3) component
MALVKPPISQTRKYFLWIPIAIEMSQSFCRLGTSVMVVQRSGQILSKEDRDMADHIMEIMKSEGVSFHLNSTIVSARELGSERELVIKNREGNTVNLRAEQILIALGRKSNLEGLGLENINIRTSSLQAMLPVHISLHMQPVMKEG